MPLPISKKQLSKLGDRIAAGDPPAKEDLAQLKEVLRAYQAILDAVEEQLVAIDLVAAARVKTRSVLIEKLRREKGMELARVQDMAGARTIVDGGWVDQDAVVARIVSHFESWTSRSSRIVDRRVRPSRGYRAVHVIVFPEGVPVEIQVRTELQNYWAQIVERLADRWGRGIRYGGDPDDGHLPAEGVARRDGSPVSRRRVIGDLREVSDEIAQLEASERELISYQANRPKSLEDWIAEILQREVADLDADARIIYPRFRMLFKRLITPIMRHGGSRLLKGGRSLRHARRLAGRMIRRTVPDVEPPDADFVRVKIRTCDPFVDDVTDELRSRLQRRQDTLRLRLQRLADYVERGGIR
ncbi:hypothetical protein BJ973_003643 [Actinoplanes tereljensis]|uniref:hypothetical protein n=1 Tax=Paractinoplanes tereljensis TaxID=571912 RepID=UPI001943B9AD|nr:hypothetical protein [Actinoplanes tereljensis]